MEDEKALGETLGQVVRQVWVNYCREIGDTKPSHIAPWAELGEADREADRRIGLELAKIGARFANIEGSERENRLHESLDKLRRRFSDLEASYVRVVKRDGRRISELEEKNATLREALADLVLHFDGVIDRDEWQGAVDAVEKARALLGDEGGHV